MEKSSFINFDNGILQFSVDKFMKSESEQEQEQEIIRSKKTRRKSSKVIKIKFNTTLFIDLECGPIIENAILKYFKIDYVDEYDESELINECLREYIIDNKLDIKEIILI